MLRGDLPPAHFEPSDRLESVAVPGRGHYRPKRCKVCGLGYADGVTVSLTGLCPTHSHERFEANADAIHAKSGPEYIRQLRRTITIAQRALIAAERAEA